MVISVFNRKLQGPATHALVIGVGHYLHLPGGTGKKKFSNNEGMAQLRAPPVSAREFARWLIEKYDCPDRPLSSVTLLVSERNPEEFTCRVGDKPQSFAVPEATMANVEEAIVAWHALGDANPEHLLLFYYCGHGISAGTELALLMSDFGEKPHAPLDGALDFRRFHRNMEECAARQQCFFVDACRVGSTLLKDNQGFAGNPIIHWAGAVANPGGQLRRGPTFFSTLSGASAYARPGKPSIFTQALIECLDGAAAADEDGPWRVKTTRLHEALDFLMLQASQDLKLPQGQIPSSDNLTQVTMNTVAAPLVPVLVRVVPESAHAKATLRCENTERKEKRGPKAIPWRLSVATGKYSFFADYKKKEYTVTPLIDELVRPPYWGKPLKATA